MSSIFNFTESKAMPFPQLPVPAKKSILWRWAFEGEGAINQLLSEIIESTEAVGPDSLTEQDWDAAIAIANKHFKHTPFFYREIPTSVVIETLMTKHEDIANDWGSWNEYHEWYCAVDDIPMHKSTERFPCLSPMGDAEIFEDGWHRLHSYIMNNHATIPVIEY